MRPSTLAEFKQKIKARAAILRKHGLLGNEQKLSKWKDTRPYTRPKKFIDDKPLPDIFEDPSE